MLFAFTGTVMRKFLQLYKYSRSYLVVLLLLPACLPLSAYAITNYTVLQPDSTERLLRLESVEIEGNRTYSESVILAYLDLVVGEGIDLDLLENARRRLEATGYFRMVGLTARPGSRRGAVVVVVSVVEKSLLSLETGFGYDDLNGWFLTLLGMRLDNTLGSATQFRLGLRLGFRLAGIDAQWEKPATYRGGFGYGLRFHAYNQSHLFFGSGPDAPDGWGGSGWRRFEQDIERIGAEALVRYRLDGNTRVAFGLHIESYKPDSTFKDPEDDRTLDAPDLPAVLFDELDKRITTGFIFRVVHDTRDNVIYPCSGAFALATLEANNSFLGGDEIFTKSTIDLRTHVPLKQQTVLSSRIKAGIISRGAPYYERFYLGGNYSVRGFEEWSLSPTEGDDGFWLVNVELRTPLIHSWRREPRLTGLIFVDAGQGWRRGESVSTGDIESSIGYGVRLRLPWLGTLGVDAGIPLSPGLTGDKFRVHGLLGFSF